MANIKITQKVLEELYCAIAKGANLTDAAGFIGVSRQAKKAVIERSLNGIIAEQERRAAAKAAAAKAKDVFAFPKLSMKKNPSAAKEIWIFFFRRHLNKFA